MSPGHPDLPALGLQACAEPSPCVEVKDVLARVGDKWSLYVVVNLHAGPLRFNELKRRIDGVSQRMLTLTLRGLERDGLVSRTVYPTQPPSVTYELTASGQTLLRPVAALVRWAQAHRDDIEQSRHAFDAQHPHAHTSGA
ncbi:helix-turn-helix domain-containing protein [Deinococcus sonorensis]|uniref:Helix-turn-helix domain-containing protein n=2 Tax=Deinococcus sonorensis TaxID=309891 RepID=A0AAU7U6R7_9DEIO